MLWKKLDNMERTMLGGGTAQYSTKSPIVSYICDFITAVGRTVPKMSYYNGGSDPYEHVTQFKRHMRLVGHGDIIMCQILRYK